MPLQVIGYCPFRPLGKGHFTEAPWSTADDILNCNYLPSSMSLDALVKCQSKALDPLVSYSEDKLGAMYQFGLVKLSGVWFGDNVSTYSEAMELCNLAKSPGYPWYYTSNSKYDVTICDGQELQETTIKLLGGEDMFLPFSLTLKDELRTRDRVANYKTRGFNASGFVHLLASKVCFSKQNQKLHDNFGRLPFTIGITVPGVGFVSAVLSLGKEQNCYDADGDGCDQRFNLSIARVIRELRKAFLPLELHACVDILYDSVYAGSTIALGVIYRLFHNKSGWECTGDDNSLYFWLALFDACVTLTGLSPDEVMRQLINGDDLGLSLNHPKLTIQSLQEYLKQYNVLISFDNPNPRFAHEINFLSHHLRERYVKGLGDVFVAAGNLDKLTSSVNWIKTGNEFSLEENCVLHLLGLRICLWPWKSEFERINEMLDSYLSTIVVTPVIRDMLKARLPENEIVSINFRLEERVVFSRASIYTVLNQIISSINSIDATD